MRSVHRWLVGWLVGWLVIVSYTGRCCYRLLLVSGSCIIVCVSHKPLVVNCGLRVCNLFGRLPRAQGVNELI
jgi:hypothetical protein